jgi:hypothetical protein
MTITLPDPVGRRIEAIAKQNGFASAAEFLISLVEEAELGADTLADREGPPELTPKSREDLDRMLDAGMNSGPPIRVTPEFWEERKRVLAERMAKRQGESP